MSILDDPSRVLGKFSTTNTSGDTYTTTVIDLACISTGSVMIRQEGEGKVHDQVYNKDECKKLGLILLAFAYPNTQFGEAIRNGALDS